jgi:tetratricopeptide (TPR) repeat protein
MRNSLRKSASPALFALLAMLAACAITEKKADEPVEEVTPAALLADGDAALERGDLPEAARAYRRAAELSDDENVAEQATRVAFDNHQLQETARAADRWLQLNPTSEQAHRYAGVAALRLHRLDYAEQHFSTLLDSAYISPAAGYLALLPIVSDEGSPTDVAQLFARLSARHTDVAEGHYAVGSTALRADNFAAALSSAKRATELAPYWLPAKLLLARTQMAGGDEEAGLATAKDAASDPQADIAVHLEYAMMLAAAGRDEESRALLTPYTTGKTVVPGALRTLALIELQRGDLDAATARFEEWLATGAQSYDALYYLGVIADRRDDEERAIRYYSRVTGGDYALPAQARVARIKAEKSGVEAGLVHLEEFGRARPQSGPDIVAARAALLSALDLEKRALETLNEGLEQYPDSIDLRMARVFLYERTDRVDASIKELRQLLGERPGDATIQNALGYTLADRTRHADEAAALVQQALQQTPDSAAVLDSMGWALHKQGKHGEALEYLERARKNGADPEIDLHLGEVQWEMDQKPAARETWKKALERWPDDERLKERLERAGP